MGCGEERGGVLSMHRLTGTNLLYHLLGDLMADGDWTQKESGRGIRSKNLFQPQNKTGQ